MIRQARWVTLVSSVPFFVAIFSRSLSAQQPATPAGAARYVIEVDSTDRSAYRTLSELLSSRVPGLLVQRANGSAGAGSSIKLRGAGSVLLVNEPLLYIDGIRADNSTTSSGTPITSSGFYNVPSLTALSRFDDISVDDIERIEVLPGAAAAALYGSGAANGVIAVTTRRPQAGPPRWRASASLGRSSDRGGYPSNYSAFAVSPAAVAGTYCPLFASAEHACVPGPLQAYSPLTANAPFRDGLLASVAASVTGGSNRFAYALAGSGARDNGTLPEDGDDRGSIRGSVRVRPSERWGVNATLSDVARSTHPTRYSLFSDLTGPLNAAGRRVDQLNFDFNTFPATQSQHVNRVLGSTDVSYRPFAWLEANAGAGLDRSNLAEHSFEGYPFPQPGPVITVSGDADHRVSTTTLTADLAATWTSGSLSTRTTVGTTHLGEHAKAAVTANSGPGALGGFSSRSLDVRLTRKTLRLVEELTMGRMSATLSGHSESDDGPEKKGKWYPAASAGFLLRESNPGSALGSVRVRGAYGAAGRGLALFRDSDLYGSAAVELVTAVSYRPFPSFSNQAGPVLPDFAESTHEAEGGFDINFLSDRIAVSVTAYDRVTRNALLPPSGSNMSSGISIENTGVEASLKARVFDRGGVTGGVDISAWANRNRFGDGPRLFLIRGLDLLKPGFAVDAYTARVITGIRDVNGDGVIDPFACRGGAPSTCEVTLSDSSVSLGSSTPTREIAVMPHLTFGKRLSVSGQLDYRGGYHLLNELEMARCLLEICRGAVDPTASFEDQAKADGFFGFGTEATFVEDASFIRLRAISVSYELPGYNARLTLAARNLATWTRYTGLDPEVNSAGAVNGLAFDLGGQPTPRTLAIRLEVLR